MSILKSRVHKEKIDRPRANFQVLLENVEHFDIRPVSMGTLKPLSGVIKLTLPIETPVIHVQGGFKVPMGTGRNLEHTTERHQRGFKVPMETGSLIAFYGAIVVIYA